MHRIKAVFSVLVLSGVLFAGHASAHTPTVSMDAIGPLSYGSFPQTYNVTGTITHAGQGNASAVADVTLFINNVQEGSSITSPGFGNEPSGTFSLPWEIDGPGTYTVKVTAKHGNPNVGSDEEVVVVSTQEPETGSITFSKEVTGAGADADLDFTFTLSWDDSAPSLSANDEPYVEELGVGTTSTYTISEAGPLPPGWAFVGAECTGGAEVEIDDETVSIELNADENVNCVFTNNFTASEEEDTGTITIVKQVTGDVADWSFDFTGDLGAFTLTDESASTTFSSVEPGEYAVNEIFPDGWNEPVVLCDEIGSGPGQGEDDLVVSVAAGDNITCTFTNSTINEGGDDEEPGEDSFTLTVTTSGDGEGVITGTGINCDSNFVASESEPVNDCSETYPEGTVVNIKAIADEPSNFNDSWSGACSGTNPDCQITMSGNMTANANFSLSSTVSGGGGNGDGGGGEVLGDSTTGDGQGSQGEVLGASTSCSEPYLTSYMREGQDNPAEQVTKLQLFLNEHMNAGLPVTGFFGPLTTAAVKAFQLKHNTEILGPWVSHGLPNSTTPTGYVYKTTLWMVNKVKCGDLNAPMPTLP